MKVWLTVLALLLSTPALAQTGTPTSYTLRVYAQGVASPVTALVVQATQVLCNQPVVNAVNVTNPTVWFWDDRTQVGKLCLFSDAERFAALPDGAYEATVQAINADGSSGESSRVPFSRRRPNPPAVPTGLRLFP